MDFIVSHFLDHHPELVLALRHAPPSRAWLAACRRCCGPEILFAFFDDLAEETEPDSAALDNLLRKFQTQVSQRIIRGGRVLLVVDGPPIDQEAFIYLDRRRYADDERARLAHPGAKHIVCEHCRVIERGSSSDNRVLESVWLPKATSVCDRTFHRCRRLVHVSLPVVESIGRNAFRRCHGLQSVSVIARDLGAGAFSACTLLRTVSLPCARSASTGLFLDCRSLESLSMPIATEVRTLSFWHCSSLTEVSLPAVRDVGRHAFQSCRNLEAVSLPSLDSVDSTAFSRCRRLSKESISAPEHVKSTLPDSLI